MMKLSKRQLLSSLVLGMALGAAAMPSVSQSPIPHRILEGYPGPVEASRQVYHRQVTMAGRSVSNVPFYLIVPTIQRWKPGTTLRVAFNGGAPDLQRKISQAASEWVTKAGANLTLSFTDASGNFRTWNTTDTAFAAEIRIAFQSGQMGGYWSHVGTDSTNRSLVGGSPGEASMNFDSFDVRLPSDWEAVVIHEFGHALGFHHEHQNPAGGCDFRFDDDPGYMPTKDSDGWFTTDQNGRRPGLYTYLGGYPNYWRKEVVDANLRAISTSSAFLIGAFDKASIMKYFFDAFMFVSGAASPCYTNSDNLTLSSQDMAGVQRAYPKGATASASAATEIRTTLEQLRTSPSASKEVVQHVTARLQAL